MMDREKRFKRGVFTMPFLDQSGRRIAVAIDGAGRCIEWVAFRPEDRVQVYTRLWHRVKAREGLALQQLIEQGS